MRNIAIIDDDAVIERFLRRLKAWDPRLLAIQPAGCDSPRPQGETLPIT
jgi:hypothetical protein